MQLLRRIQSFTGRHTFVGPTLWLLTAQYFFVQIIVASAWNNPPYSWRLNAISDLGATHCGPFDGRVICSSSHALMNVSLILLGLCMAIGSVLMYQRLHRSRVGFWLMAIAGIGAILVGMYPEDTVYWAHITGADLAFLIGNIALIVFGFTLRFPRWFRAYSIVSGVVALVALYLFLSHNRFFLGLGGMERVVAYPQTIWLIVCGLYVIRCRKV